MCSRYNIPLTEKERGYLEDLFQEELDIYNVLLKYSGVKKDRKNFETIKDFHNYCYGKKNPFRINFKDIHSEIKEHFDSYSFLFIKDKRERVLGYICFEVSDLNFVGENYKIIKIKHFYLSNSLCKMKKIPDIMYIMLNYILPETELQNMYIVSDVHYSFCNGFNGFYKLVNPVVFSKNDYDNLYIKPPLGKIFKF